MTRLRTLGCTKSRNKRREFGLVRRDGKKRPPWSGPSAKKLIVHLKRGCEGRSTSLSLYLWVGAYVRQDYRQNVPWNWQISQVNTKC